LFLFSFRVVLDLVGVSSDDMIESYFTYAWKCRGESWSLQSRVGSGRMHSFIEALKREKCEWGDGLGAVGDSIAALKEG
jgi:hypothetical protein